MGPAERGSPLGDLCSPWASGLPGHGYLMGLRILSCLELPGLLRNTPFLVCSGTGRSFPLPPAPAHSFPLPPASRLIPWFCGSRCSTGSFSGPCWPHTAGPQSQAHSSPGLARSLPPSCQQMCGGRRGGALSCFSLHFEKQLWGWRGRLVPGR